MKPDNCELTERFSTTQILYIYSNCRAASVEQH